MCETCREAPGFPELPEQLEEPCLCECNIRKNVFLKFRPLVCHECSHIAAD